MNLEEFGVQEMNVQEVKAIDGGSWYSELAEGIQSGSGRKATRDYDGWG
nr:hypothetical protein [uncultured Marinifilum sp.]